MCDLGALQHAERGRYQASLIHGGLDGASKATYIASNDFQHISAKNPNHVTISFAFDPSVLQSNLGSPLDVAGIAAE